MAKSRVKSLKPLTVPRIELQAALLGSRLADTIQKGHNIKINKRYFWTDSKIVYYWINSNPKKFKTYVANRVGEILELTSEQEWRWLPTQLNVADEATRGLWNLARRELWFRGPEFLKLDETEWPQQDNLKSKAVDESELKNHVLLTIEPSYMLIDFSKFSNYLRMVRTMAWVMRFVKICKMKTGLIKINMPEAQLTIEEFEEAENELIKKSQYDSFTEEVSQMVKKLNIKTSSRIFNLNPNFDDNRILIFNGRLNNADELEDSTKRPIILDAKHAFTKLLIGHYHITNHHQGREQTLNELRQRFWILNGRNAVRNYQKGCIVCRKKNSKLETQQMAAIPKCRVAPQVRAFILTGMDYFGPMNVAIGRRREKRYGVLFTCLSTRAIHLEVSSSLTTDFAIMAIRRFVCRRGSPQEIYSDNGSNLKGAEKELREAITTLNQCKIQESCLIKRIKWHFNPPATPHMGGVWERMVKSVKVALKTILKEQCPKQEILQTLMVEVEYTVNSHPLTYVSTDPLDPESLTPNHFLIGRECSVQAAVTFNDTEKFYRKQWQIAQKYADMFWKRWLREYVPTLVKRSRWPSDKRNLQEGDIVIVCDENLPRNQWMKGVILQAFPGSDQKVRVVEIKTVSGVYRRPVAKLILLLANQAN